MGELPVLTEGLVLRTEGVEAGELGEAAGHHLRGGVKLHGAGAYPTLSQSIQPSHSLSAHSTLISTI